MMTKPLSIKDSVATVWNILNKVTPKAPVKRKAPEDTSGNVRKKQMLQSALLRCPFCEKKFKRILNLRKHVTAVHKVSYVDVQSDEGSIRCGVDPLCRAAFDRSVFYRKHLHQVHNFELGKKVLFFDTKEDFEAWRQTEQAKTGAKFTKRYKSTPSQRHLNVKKITFLCTSPAHTKIKDKTYQTGFRKLECSCPSRIDAVIRKDNVIASYFSTHIGHTVTTPEEYMILEKRKLDRQRKLYEAAQRKAEFLCTQLLEKLKAGKFTIEHIIDTTLNLKALLNPSPTQLQESLPWKTNTTTTVPHISLLKSSVNEEHILGLSEATIEHLALISDSSTSSRSNKVDEISTNDKTSCVNCSNNLDPFSGKGKIFTAGSDPSDCPIEQKIRKTGFLHNLESITPVIAEDILKEDFVYPDPPSEETKTLYEDVWNKYKNSLKTSRTDHTYTEL